MWMQPKALKFLCVQVRCLFRWSGARSSLTCHQRPGSNCTIEVSRFDWDGYIYKCDAITCLALKLGNYITNIVFMCNIYLVTTCIRGNANFYAILQPRKFSSWIIWVLTVFPTNRYCFDVIVRYIPPSCLLWSLLVCGFSFCLLWSPLVYVFSFSVLH